MTQPLPTAWRAARRATGAALLALLPACGEEAPRPAAEDPRLAAARAEAEATLRPRLRPSQEQHRLVGVQAFPQALPGTFAVCGRVSGPGQGHLLPYVAVVVFEGNAPRVAELVAGTGTAEASRVYAEMVERCFEGGGPPTARGAARPLPPLPAASVAPPPLTAAPPAAAQAAAVVPPPRAAAPPPASDPARAPLRRVTTTSRHGANIRSAPQGGGEVVRVAPRSSELEVYAEAPGGWLQVGQGGQPWGWVHASVLEGPGR